jgi:hypothetical protein
MTEQELRQILELVQSDPEVRHSQNRLDALRAQLKSAAESVSMNAKVAERAKFAGEAQQKHLEALLRFKALDQTFSGELETLLAKIEEKYKIPIRDLTERERPRFGNRVSKKELHPGVVPSTASLERSLDSNLHNVLASLPAGWLRRELPIARRELTARRSGSLLLIGNTRVKPLHSAHPLAYSIVLGEALMAKKLEYDVFDSSLWIPMIAALCDRLEGLKSVRNGLKKLRMLHKAPKEEFESSIYELLVAGSAAELGRDVEFLPPIKSSKTPDLRVHDFPVPLVVECKLQSRLSEAEYEEAKLFSGIGKALSSQKCGLLLELEISGALTSVEAQKIVEFSRSLSSSSELSVATFEWGELRGSLLPSNYGLTEQMRVFSPRFINSICSWDEETWDGVFLDIRNANEIVSDTACSPVCVKWRLHSESDLRRKARSVIRLISEAIEQVPAGEAACIYVGFEDTHRAEIADARTRLIREQIEALYHYRRAISLAMIVIDRIYPRPLADGQPDMIESAIPFAASDDTPYALDMPRLVFVPPE